MKGFHRFIGGEMIPEEIIIPIHHKHVPIPPRSTSPCPSRNQQSRTQRLVRRVSSALGIQENQVKNNTSSHVVFSIEQIHAIINISPSEMCLIDINGTILHSNTLFQTIFPQNLTNLIHTICIEDRDRFCLNLLTSNQPITRHAFLTLIPKSNDSLLTDEIFYLWSFSKQNTTNGHVVILVTLQLLNTSSTITALTADVYLNKSDEIISTAFDMHAFQSTSIIKTNTIPISKLNHFLRRMEIRKTHAKKIADEVIEAKSIADALKKRLDAKRVFVRYISHELRTPLTVMMAGLEMLLTHILSDISKIELKEQLEEIHNAGVTAVEILNDMLAFEMLDAKNLGNITKAPCDLKNILEKTLDMFRLQAKYSNIDLRLDTPLDGAIIVEGNAAKLAQAARNVIANAFKFTPEGGAVEVRLNIDEETKLVIVEVQDSGPGLSPDAKAALFKSGDEFDPTELQSEQGAGLGLFITRNIIEMHEGAIGVDMNWTGRGSLFKFELPYDSIQGSLSNDKSITYTNKETILPDSEIIQQNQFPCLNYTPRVLVVDDVVICRKILMKLLTVNFSAIDFEEACNGVEAIECVRMAIASGNPFDCILMDSSMPVMTGPCATREIRNMGFSGKIYGVTGNAFQVDIDDFLENGANEVFVKPASSKLVERLKEVFI